MHRVLQALAVDFQSIENELAKQHEAAIRRAGGSFVERVSVHLCQITDDGVAELSAR